MALPREHLLDELATAYIQAIVAISGATISVSRRDYWVDGSIEQIATTAEGYFETGYPVDFQLKGTTRVTDFSSSLPYDLKVRNYNLIVGRRPAATPYYLFLVCFGAELENRLLLRR